jgi:exportin-2 (importin alpha re-exporter)
MTLTCFCSIFSMFGMVVERVFVTDMNKVSGELDQKIVVVGATKLLCDCPTLLAQPYIKFWPLILQVGDKRTFNFQAT